MNSWTLWHWYSYCSPMNSWMLWHWYSYLFYLTGADVGFRFILKSRAYQNNSLVSLENIGEGRDALFCIANISACCRPPYTPRALGNWFFPNGTRVPSSGLKWDFHRTRGQMVVLLQRRRGGENGIYHCVVPDATNVIQTIYIGVYTGSPGEFPLDHGVLYSLYIGMAWFLKPFCIALTTYH